MNNKFSEIVSHLINNGFVFPSSQIYGGLANVWDYGPLGSELKNNIKQFWHREFVQRSEYNVLVDTAIFMNKKVWEATGHANAFNDPMFECKVCKTRYRVDHFFKKNFANINIDDMSFEQIDDFIKTHDIKCEKCSKENCFTNVKKFNMMFKVNFGTTSETNNDIFLRPETAQGVFVNFKNVQRSTRRKLPFGICNYGKSFRNEITLGNFIFRTKEFEQLEMEFFCKCGTDNEWFEYWKEKCFKFIINLGINEGNIHYREHNKNELAFYSKRTVDIEYYFQDIGWGEILGIANRTDYDLKRHMEYSKESLEYIDGSDRCIPYCIEPSMGLDRIILMVLVDSFKKEKLSNGSERIVMKINPLLSPYKIAILPLDKSLAEEAKKIFNDLSKKIMCIYDDTGSIGKRYRREDAIGTPFAVTVDYETLKDKTVTIRNRNDMKQIRVNQDKIFDYVKNILDKC